MKFNKTMMICVSSVLLVGAATFAFAAPQSTTTTATTKTKKSKKTTETKATTAPAPAATKATTATTKKSETTQNATPAQIAAAKSAGQVWVNTGSSTKAYHDSSSQYYGATKAGKFMSEKDAIAAGYHKAKNEK